MINFTITKEVLDTLIFGARAVLETYLPALLKKYFELWEESGNMPTEEQILAMLKDIKDPDYYDTLYPRQDE